MVRCTVDMRRELRLVAESFVGSDGGALAWLEIGDGSGLAVFGSAGDLRNLAAAAIVAADRADELLAAAAHASDRPADENSRIEREGAGL
jgi:hypothetical protein